MSDIIGFSVTRNSKGDFQNNCVHIYKRSTHVPSVSLMDWQVVSVSSPFQGI